MPLERVLLVSQPAVAGTPRHVLSVLPALVGAGLEVDVVCPRDSELAQGIAAAGWPTVHLHPMSGRRAPSPSDLLSVARLIPLARRADIIHAHSSKAGFVARLAALLAGRRQRTVFTPHGWSFWAFDGRQGGFYAALERLAARWCSTIVALTDAEAAAGVARRVGRPGQYRVIRGAVDLARFGAAPAPVPGRLVMVARLAEPRLPGLVVEALAAVARRPGCSEVHVHLVGDGPLADGARRRAADLGVSDRVAFLGDRDDVPALLASAAVVVHASRYEGASLAVVEAMAAGRPVVASDVAGMGEIVRNGTDGLLCVNEAAVWADAIGALLADPGRAEAMGGAARDRARAEFSLERLGRETLDLYRTLSS